MDFTNLFIKRKKTPSLTALTLLKGRLQADRVLLETAAPPGVERSGIFDFTQPPFQEVFYFARGTERIIKNTTFKR